MLSNWKDIFEYNTKKITIKAIAALDHNGNSTEFIEFMLKIIDETLEELIHSTSVQANQMYYKNY